MLLSLLLLGVPLVSTLFFGGGGGGGCCCGCGTPQPASCGCQPACPQADPCPVCPTPQCPPPPAAYCPQVSPVYIPSCSGGSCDSGCSGGGCGGGGGGGCNGGNCGGGGGGGYASSGGFAAGPTYAQSSGGGYAQTSSNYAAPLPVSSYGPTSPVGYAQPSGGSTASFAPTGGSYSQGAAPTGGSYSQGAAGAAPVPAAGGNYQSSYRAAEDPVTSAGAAPAATAHGTQQQCDGQGPVKYVVLRAKKLSGTGIEEVNEEEMEEVSRPSNVEATASPLDTKDIGEDITSSLEEQGRPQKPHKRNYEPMKAKMMFGALYENFAAPAKARSANTLSESKCNSKPLKDLVLENIAKDDALLSKRQIHEASIRKFPEHSVDVICSGTGFTYLVATTEHCEAQKDNVICFVYKRPL